MEIDAQNCLHIVCLKIFRNIIHQLLKRDSSCIVWRICKIGSAFGEEGRNANNSLDITDNIDGEVSWTHSTCCLASGTSPASAKPFSKVAWESGWAMSLVRPRSNLEAARKWPAVFWTQAKLNENIEYRTVFWSYRTLCRTKRGKEARCGHCWFRWVLGNIADKGVV